MPPTPHRSIAAYYDALHQFTAHGAHTEGATRIAFQNLLAEAGRPRGWTVLAEQTIVLPGAGKRMIRLDGELRDQFKIRRGVWEAKDTADDLDTEIRKKIAAGYPTKNTIFENTQRAVLYQDDQRALDLDITQPSNLQRLLDQFFDYAEPQIDEFHRAVAEFRSQIPDLARGLSEIIEVEKRGNRRFAAALDAFWTLCKASLNPATTLDDVENMLKQHLLTERIFRSVFDNPDFVRRNAIARELETVVDALTSRSLNRGQFTRPLDYFYRAIEQAAATIDDYSEKQSFLNTVYEQFFRSYSTDTADTHGIVYTPAPIVRWMVASVEQALRREWGKSLSDQGVHVLDPCVGTGTFMLELIDKISSSTLRQKYAHELHCNEVLLLPYYIAAQNIEHEYWERTGEYAPFEGIVFADTLDMSRVQAEMFAPENTERIQRQEAAPIQVIIGNPPYNVGQVNENDNNKNRKHPDVDKRISATYARSSRATNKKALSDMYVKFFRWATDRLGDRDGVICFVSNNSFLDQFAFDGMRKELLREFTAIYTLDLGGNVRQNPKLSGTTHNVFGIQVGVAITLLIRNRRGAGPHPGPSGHPSPAAAERGENAVVPSPIAMGEGTAAAGGRGEGRPASVFYTRVDEWWRREQKYAFLDQKIDYTQIEWQELTPDARGTWLTAGSSDDFHSFLPIGNREAKAGASGAVNTIFRTYSRGAETTRDDWVYDWDRDRVATKIRRFIDTYNSEVDRWMRLRSGNVDDFVLYDDSRIKWSSSLKQHLQRGARATFETSKIRRALYRPFTRISLFFDDVLIHRPGLMPSFFPTADSENRVIVVSDVGYRAAFSTLLTDVIPDLHLIATSDAFQCFPFYTYDEDGSNRRENITDWALEQFRARYGPHPGPSGHPSPTAVGEGKEMEVPSPAAAGEGTAANGGRGEGHSHLTKWDIFHYIYGLLHAPDYRAKYAQNLKRDLPHIPLVAPESFAAFVAAGRRLAELHVGYEAVAPYPLRHIEDRGVAWTWRVEKMRLSADKTSLRVNEALTLAGIPPEVFDYRLGNRSALDWVIDQYQIKTDKRSGITSDPNNPDDPEAIVRLVKQVVAVSLETVRIVAGLPPVEADQPL